MRQGDSLVLVRDSLDAPCVVCFNNLILRLPGMQISHRFVCYHITAHQHRVASIL